MIFFFLLDRLVFLIFYRRLYLGTRFVKYTINWGLLLLPMKIIGIIPTFFSVYDCGVVWWCECVHVSMFICFFILGCRRHVGVLSWFDVSLRLFFSSSHLSVPTERYRPLRISNIWLEIQWSDVYHHEADRCSKWPCLVDIYAFQEPWNYRWQTWIA